LELRPEALAPSAELVDNLASWRDFYGAFYALWLDSAEFETWARSQLADPTGPVNMRGLSLRSQLESNHRKTYYWWFQDTGTDDFEALVACPVCRSCLVDRGLVGLVCDACSVLVANSGWRA
jgi:predicted  nucleic acid-binding Zn ribbon protein